MQYKTLKIYKEDYGCEGVPEDEEQMCSVFVQDVEGNEKWIKLADSYLMKYNLNEGDSIEV